MRRVAFRLVLVLVVVGVGAVSENAQAAPFPMDCCDPNLQELCNGYCFAAYGTMCDQWECIPDGSDPCFGSFTYTCT